MAKINGIVRDYTGKILENAEVLFVDRGFNVLASGYSNEDGEYYLQVNEKTNGMIVGTYSYGEKYLAYTFANISTHLPHRIDVTIGNVEFIQYKREVGIDRTDYICTFQVASLDKMHNGAKYISPRLDEETFTVLLDEKEKSDFVLTKEKVFIEVKGINIDAYRLSFKSDLGDRGKVLTLLYKEGEEYGMLKCFV